MAPITYRDAGVDVEAGYEAVRLMKQHVAKTFNPNVIGDLGSFGGFYSIENAGIERPVLVAGCDGVGTKLKYAFVMDKHDTVGIDCVAMCVNDIVCQGAMPLFFLDYLATGKLQPGKAAEIVQGVAIGCLQANCALIGGETAEMPGFYPVGEYDLAGFSVGIVGRDQAITGANVKAGDALIGLSSTGVHSNGFSLVRRLLGEDKISLERHSIELGCVVGEEVLRPTQIYVNVVHKLMAACKLNGIAHITGGGFIENIPRILPPGTRAKIFKGSWPVLPIFNVLQKLGDVPVMSMYNTFNMGIGMVIALPATQADEAVRIANENGQKAYVIGEIIEGDSGVEGFV